MDSNGRLARILRRILQCYSRSMFQRILPPLDGSRESEPALSPASTLAITLRAEVLLVRVGASKDSTLAVVSSDATAEAHDYLSGIASTLDVSRMETEVVVSEGRVAEWDRR